MFIKFKVNKYKNMYLYLLVFIYIVYNKYVRIF